MLTGIIPKLQRRQGHNHISELEACTLAIKLRATMLRCTTGGPTQHDPQLTWEETFTCVDLLGGGHHLILGPGGARELWYSQRNFRWGEIQDPLVGTGGLLTWQQDKGLHFE